MKIVLDPGHSGPFEPGACAAGVTEAELVLSIARRIRRRLLAAGHEVRLTRSGDIDDDGLAWRCDLSNRWNADRFLSIHANSFGNAAARGSEVWHYPGSAAGEALARVIQANIVTRLHTVNRGVKAANFQVLRDTDCPAVLIETAFISNPGDRALLIQAEFQENLAIAVAESLGAVPRPTALPRILAPISLF